MTPYLQAVSALWAIFCIYWLIAARGGKRDISHETAPRQLLSSGGFFIGFFLMFARVKSHNWPWLGEHLYDPSPLTGSIGCALAGAGLVIALWARRTLGANWSRVVARKENHELVTTGPYRWIRHPIYAGMLLLALGTAIVMGETKAFVALAFILASALVRVFAEDALMASSFPDAFPAWRRRTARLIPWVF